VEKGVWQGQGSSVSIAAAAAVVGIRRFGLILLEEEQDTDCNTRWWVDWRSGLSAGHWGSGSGREQRFGGLGQRHFLLW